MHLRRSFDDRFFQVRPPPPLPQGSICFPSVPDIRDAGLKNLASTLVSDLQRGDCQPAFDFANQRHIAAR